MSHAHALVRRSRVLCVLAALVVLLPAMTTAPSPASAASPDVPVGHYGSLDDLQEVTPMATSPVITAGSCKYQQVTDNVHFSATGFAASAHGWWKKSSGTCPSKANVDAQLQAVWCGSGPCQWRTVDSNSDDVYSGGGSANRVAVRENCSGSKTTGYRIRVDVDLIGVSDPSGWTNSAGVDLACYPSS